MTHAARRIVSLLAVLILIAAAQIVPIRADQRIWIPAKLNGQSLRLAFDTGSSDLIILRSVAEARGIKFSPPAPGARADPGQVLVGTTEPVRFEIFGRALVNVRLNVFDPAVPSVLGGDGVIGWTNIRSNLWFLSGASLNLTVLNGLPPGVADWTKLKERTDQRVLSLVLPRERSGGAALLGIDTGSPDGVELSPEQWAQWRSAHPKQPVSLLSYYMPGAGVVVSEEAWADDIDLFGLTLHGVPVSCMNAVETSLQPAGTVAVLGLAALLRMDIVFDGKGGVTYAHPLGLKPLKYVHNRLGAVFVPATPDATDLVAHVASGSPAAMAGVMDGDVLLKIDRLDVTAWRTQPGILPLSRFWEDSPGKHYRLTLRRAGKVVTVDAVLRVILGAR